MEDPIKFKSENPKFMSQQKKDAPYKSEFPNLEAMEAAVGRELGLSDWMPISQERINAFAEVTEDHQWIHTDPAQSAKFSPYQTTIAHGFLVLSLASKMVAETYQLGGIGMGINYGLDRVRFPNATRVGDEIRARVFFAEYQPIERGARLKMEVTFEIKGREKPACVAEFITLIYKTN